MLEIPKNFASSRTPVINHQNTTEHDFKTILFNEDLVTETKGEIVMRIRTRSHDESDLKTRHLPVILHLFLTKTLARKSRDSHDVVTFCFEFNVLCSHLSAKPAFPTFSGLRAFSKAFSWRSSVNGRSNRRNKTVFSNSSVMIWTGHWKNETNYWPRNNNKW